MTNYVTFEALKKGDISLQDSVSISEKAWRTEGSRMFAKVGTQIELKHLLKSTIIQSGNDAAVALAGYIGGSELQFAQSIYFVHIFRTLNCNRCVTALVFNSGQSHDRAAFGQIWSNLTQSEHIWSSLIKTNQILSNLIQSGQVWFNRRHDRPSFGPI